MRYLFQQSNGNSTTYAIVEKPSIKDGIVHATQVGKIAGWNKAGDLCFQPCPPVDFIAGGGPWTLTEYQGQL